MQCPQCGKQMAKNGLRKGKQRWVCPLRHSLTENPSKPGPKPVGGRAKTGVERQRKYDWRKKLESLGIDPETLTEGIIEEVQEQSCQNELADDSEAESEG